MSAPRHLPTALAILALFVTVPAMADNPTPYPGTVVLETQHTYEVLTARLVQAVKTNGMGVVARASATLGAKSLGIDLPGNQVIMVYHPKFAVRMLEAYVPAGFEAPIRYYITENADGTATLTYRTPSSVFAPYGNKSINEMAKELDAIFDRITKEAVAG